MSNIKKRGYTDIDDEEDEEKELFYGSAMLELYSVAIKEIKGDHIYGKIIVEPSDFTPPALIYDGDEGKHNNIGKPLSLTGLCQPFLAEDPIAFWFHIGPDPDPDADAEEVVYVWVPRFTPYNRVVTMEIGEKWWGKVALKFLVFSKAVDVRVNVMFLGRRRSIIDDDDGKKKYPTHVYGEIYATTCDRGGIETKVVLFRKSEKEAEPVENGEPIRLSRPVIAAQLRSNICINVDLWGCYHDSSVAIQTSFVGCVGVDPYSCKCELETPPGVESPVQVDVTWMDRPIPSWSQDSKAQLKILLIDYCYNAQELLDAYPPKRGMLWKVFWHPLQLKNTSQWHLP